MNSLKEIYLKLISNKASKYGILIIIVYVMIAVFAPYIAKPSNPRDPYIVKQHGYSPKPEKPSKKAMFGTTQNQYDIFYAMVWGTRLAFKISIIAVFISFMIGLILGWISGYYGGIIDEIIMRITDIVLSIPSLVLAIVIVAILGQGIEKLITAITLVSWPGYARLFRSEVLKLKSMDFITASKISGANAFWILRKHIIPNAIYTMVIMATLDIANIVLMAASLGFLGLGSPQGYADWGQIISMSRNWIIASAYSPLEYWHTVFIPFVFIFMFILAFNMVGDSFRDIFDPKNIR